MPRKVIVARLSQDELNDLYETHFRNGYNQCRRDFQQKEADLREQKLRLDMEQTKAVTDLLRAADENLSKAGYLIGKLNKDNSR